MFSVVDENFIQRPPKKKSDVVGRETVINLLVNHGQKFCSRSFIVLVSPLAHSLLLSPLTSFDDSLPLPKVFSI